MTFDSTLKKERGPSVFALFEFKLAENAYYRYTDADEAVRFNGNVFTPEQVTYSDVVSDGTLKKTTLDVETRYGLKPAKVFRVDPPSFVTTLTIWEANFTDRDREFRMVWSGRVLNCKIEREKAKFSCEPLSTTLARPGLRRNYQRPCPHALYGPLCKAARVEQAVSWIGGTANQWTVTKPNTGLIGPGTYEGGLVSWVDSDNLTRYQTILTSQEDGANLVLGVNRALSPSQTPKSIKLVKGCNHTETACSLWHGNIVNYGGCPFIPSDSPINKFSTYY